MCSMKTILKVVLGIALLAGIAYVALPEQQTSIATITPILLSLACPLAMLLMAFGMTKDKNNAAVGGSGNEQAGCRHAHAARKPATEGERHA